MLIQQVVKLDANGVQETFDLSVTSTESALTYNGEIFTPKVPNTLSSDGDSLKLLNGTTGYGSITKGDLRTLLNVDKTNNTADADKPLSTATTDALATKHDKITAISKLPMPLVDGLDAAIALMATKSDLAAVSSNISLGIKYEWANAAAQTAQTGMLEGEQGVLVGADNARDVYTYKGGAWSYAYKLSSSHNHDERYYQKTEADAALLPKMNKSDNLPMTQVTGLATSLGGHDDIWLACVNDDQ